MNKENVTRFFKGVRTNINKRSPEILTGVGIAGMITTTVLAVRATPKALRLIEKAEDHGIGISSKEGDPDWKYRPLTKLEVIKVAWKPYIPAVLTCGLSIGCLIGAQSVNTRRITAISTAYKLSETALTEYKAKVIETIGEKKEHVIRDKVAQQKVDDHPITKSEVIVTGGGDVIFLEPVSMRYFKSDIETVRKIINDLNYRLTTGAEEYISLSEFYDEIGLSHTSNSDDIGWNLYRDGQIEIEMSATKTDKGEPCLMLGYGVSPRYDYTKLM